MPRPARLGPRFVVLRVSDRTARRSEADARSLVIGNFPPHRVFEGDILVTEDRRVMACFHVESMNPWSDEPHSHAEERAFCHKGNGVRRTPILGRSRWAKAMMTCGTSRSARHRDTVRWACDPAAPVCLART